MHVANYRTSLSIPPSREETKSFWLTTQSICLLSYLTDGTPHFRAVISFTTCPIWLFSEQPLIPTSLIHFIFIRWESRENDTRTIV